MKTFPTVLFVGLIIGSVFSSCNKNKDDDGTNTLPDLTATVSVSGAVNESYTFTNPENGGSNAQHAMVSGHINSTGQLSISGTNLNYTYAIAANAQSVQAGSYQVSAAQFNHVDGAQSMGFGELIGGTVTITSAQLLWVAGVATIHSIDGNWSIEISDQQNPPNTITFSGTFDNLAVTAN